MVAFWGFVSWRANASSTSTAVSPVTDTVTLWAAVEPGGKVTTPDAAAKSSPAVAVPDAVALDGLRRSHPGRLLTLSFRDESVSQSAVFAEIIGRGVEFELVFGGIEDVRGRSFGRLTLELRGDASAIDEAVAAVGALVETTEVA